MAHITDAFKGSHQYTGKINGKTFVVPHGKLDIYSNNYHKAHSDETITSRDHVAKHNPDFSKEEVDAVHSHIKKVHGGKMNEEVETPPIHVRSSYTKAYAKHHMKGRDEARKASYAEVEKKHGSEMTTKLKAFHDHNEKSLQEDTLEEGRPMVGDVFHRHQTLVAKKTLKMHDAAVGVMGGMNKDEARAHLSKMGWTKKQIHDHEHSLNETGQLVEHGFVGFDHKGNRHEVEASSLLAAVEHIRKKANTPKSKHHLVHAKIAEKDTPEGRKQVVHTPMDEAFELNEASLTPKEKEKKEEIVKAMKKDKAGFVKRYGKKAKEVMHATATKKAQEMKEDNTLTLVKELIHEAAFTRRHFRQVADIIKNHPDPKKRHEMASHHAEIFKKSNPRFDHKRFFDAAGVKEDK